MTNKIVYKMKLTPVYIYGILLIVDNLLYLPIWGETFGCFNQGALGNIMSLIIIVLSVICVFLERLIVIKKQMVSKNIIFVELIFILLSTLFYWLVFLSPPFPTLRRLMA